MTDAIELLLMQIVHNISTAKMYRRSLIIGADSAESEDDSSEEEEENSILTFLRKLIIASHEKPQHR